MDTFSADALLFALRESGLLRLREQAPDGLGNGRLRWYLAQLEHCAAIVMLCRNRA